MKRSDQWFDFWMQVFFKYSRGQWISHVSWLIHPSVCADMRHYTRADNDNDFIILKGE